MSAGLATHMHVMMYSHNSGELYKLVDAIHPTKGIQRFAGLDANLENDCVHWVTMQVVWHSRKDG